MTPTPWGRRHPREFWSGYFRFLLALIAAAIIITLLASNAMPARAHEFWINNYSSLSDQTSCCGKNDCFEFKDVRATPAGWWIVVLQETVPYSDTQASEDNKFWRCKRYDGSRRCFFAPQPSS